MAGLDWFVIEDEAGLTRLVPEWRRLAEAAPAPGLFASPEWVLTWWRHFGAGRTLHVAGARRDGALVALALTCTTRSRTGVRVREFLGSEEADLADLLLAPGEEALAGALAGFMLNDRDWDLVDLWCLPGGAPGVGAVAEALRGAGRGVETTTLTINPVIDLTSPDWSRGASPSFLSTVARKRRGLRREGPLELTFPKSPEQVDEGLGDLSALHRARWRSSGEVSRLDLPGYSRWVRGVTQEAFRHGWLYMPRLVRGSRVVATGIYFLYRRRLFYWLGAYDVEFARYSPYHALVLSIVEDVRASGAADVFDFGRGDEAYKLCWTRDAFPLVRVMGWRGVRGRAAHLWRGRVRPWAWAHPGFSRPVRGLKRTVQRLIRTA